MIEKQADYPLGVIRFRYFQDTQFGVNFTKGSLQSFCRKGFPVHNHVTVIGQETPVMADSLFPAGSATNGNRRHILSHPNYAVDYFSD